jgi:hypothetical protein
MPHVLFGVLTSYTIGNWLTPSFLDILLQIKKLPYLPALLNKEAYSKTALSSQRSENPDDEKFPIDEYLLKDSHFLDGL